MSFIRINNIWQEYGDHVVLERLNLQINEGEFCSMVGASGCGKSAQETAEPAASSAAAESKDARPCFNAFI